MLAAQFFPLIRSSGNAPESTQDTANATLGNSFVESSNSADAQSMKNQARRQGFLTASIPKGQ